MSTLKHCCIRLVVTREAIRLIKLATKVHNKILRVKYGGRGLNYFLVHQSYHNNNYCDVYIYTNTLLSQIIATMISTVKFERNNRPFTIEDILKGEFNWNMYEITLPCYVINMCILNGLHSKQHGFLKEVLIGYTHANLHHATTFGCRNIAFQILWLPCNPHRSEWPKTFFGRCIWLIIIIWETSPLK